MTSAGDFGVFRASSIDAGALRETDPSDIKAAQEHAQALDQGERQLPPEYAQCCTWELCAPFGSGGIHG
jgi:hypothetical protein